MKIYFAGPNIFFFNYEQWKDGIRNLCAKYPDLEPLFPGDDDISLHTSKDIYYANLGLIRQSNFVVANLNSFRGFEPDSGTVFECGYAKAHGKAIIGVLADQRTLIERLDGKHSVNGLFYDKDGATIENFEHPINLMLFHSVDKLTASHEEAIDLIKNFAAYGSE